MKADRYTARVVGVDLQPDDDCPEVVGLLVTGLPKNLAYRAGMTVTPGIGEKPGRWSSIFHYTALAVILIWSAIGAIALRNPWAITASFVSATAIIQYWLYLRTWRAARALEAKLATLTGKDRS